MNPDYNDWLNETGLTDTEENKGWFDCPDEDRAGYIRTHTDWWETF